MKRFLAVVFFTFFTLTACSVNLYSSPSKTSTEISPSETTTATLVPTKTHLPTFTYTPQPTSTFTPTPIPPSEEIVLSCSDNPNNSNYYIKQQSFFSQLISSIYLSTSNRQVTGSKLEKL